MKRYIKHNKTKRRVPICLVPFTVTVYLFLAKNMMALFKNAKKRYPVDFSSVYGTMNEKSAIEGTTKPRGGYRYTVYCHGISLSGKNYDVAFYSD